MSFGTNKRGASVIISMLFICREIIASILGHGIFRLWTFHFTNVLVFLLVTEYFLPIFISKFAISIVFGDYYHCYKLRY